MLIVHLIWFSTPVSDIYISMHLCEEVWLHKSTKIIKTPANILLGHLYIANWTTWDLTLVMPLRSINPDNLHLTINHAKSCLHVLIISHTHTHILYSTERSRTFHDTICTLLVRHYSKRYPVSSRQVWYFRLKYIYKIFMTQAALSFIRNETFEKDVWWYTRH